MIIRSINHLKEVQQSYWEHGYFALRWGFYIIILGLASIIHGIFPGILPFYTPNGIKKIASMIEKMDQEREKIR